MDKYLLGVIFSQFDNRVGPQLCYQYPDQIISQQVFDCISDYVIVGPHLNGKIITVKYNTYQFMNCSIAIDDVKYHRNTLLFAVGFVVSDYSKTVIQYDIPLY